MNAPTNSTVRWFENRAGAVRWLSGSGMAAAASQAAQVGFLWEQIAVSVDAVELHEVRRVVGGDLVQSCEDMYAEVRALQDILHEFSATTDELVEENSSKAEKLRASNVGLVALEVKQLVAHLLQARPGAAGPSAGSLLPKAAHSQQLALVSILGERAALPRRPHTAQPAGARSSLREIRGMAERQHGFDRLSLDGTDCSSLNGEAEPRRPYTTTGAECTRYRATAECFASGGADACRPLSASSGGSRPTTARPPVGSTSATGSGVSRPATASSRPATASSHPATASSRPVTASSRPATASSRPATASSHPATFSSHPATASSRPATASSSASVDSSITAEALHGGDRGSAVVVALRAALEEVRHWS